MTQPADDQLAGLLNECCELVMAGESVAACLERYPEHADALAPLLSAVAEMRQLRPVPVRFPPVAAQSRAEFITAAQQTAVALQARSQHPWVAIVLWWRRLWSGLIEPFRWRGVPHAVPVGLIVVLIAILVFGVLTTGVVTASAKALPGDPLYPVKTVTERARVLLTSDPDARAALIEQINQQRLLEAKIIVAIRRPVRRMAIAGTIENLASDQWVVSGLPIAITRETRIEGTPQVGARVQGTVRAPGDGTLIALTLVVESLPGTSSGGPPVTAASPTASMTPTLSPTRATATTTLLPTVTVQPTATEQPQTSEDEDISEPIVAPSEVPTAIQTPTPKPTATGTPAPTVTVMPTPTTVLIPSATPRAEPTRQTAVRVIDWVVSIDGTRWTIGNVTVDTDANTVFIGNPGVGYLVEAILQVRADGSYLALVISTVSSPTATPAPYDLTGVVQAKSADRWTIEGVDVRIDDKTIIEGDPQVGDWVEVKAETRSGGGIWALQIRKLSLIEYQFEGLIESMAESTWRVGGYTILITAQTQIIGQPALGRYAQVDAVERPDKALVAKLIYVVPDTPTPTATATASATMTSTSTPEPALTAIEAPPTPTSTDTPTSVATETPTTNPEAIALPSPTATAVALPRAAR